MIIRFFHVGEIITSTSHSTIMSQNWHRLHQRLSIVTQTKASRKYRSDLKYPRKQSSFAQNTIAIITSYFEKNLISNTSEFMWRDKTTVKF